MAKKAKPLVTYTQADLKKMSRSQARRAIDLGMVEGVTAPAVESEAATAKAKAK